LYVGGMHADGSTADLGTASVEVYQGTKLLSSGHNRQAATDAGIAM
jgi:hypothetical protein